MSDGVNKIISTFFENSFTSKTQLLFRKWLRLNENIDEKENAMSQLWENSPSTVTVETIEDLEKIREKIAVSENLSQQRVFNLRRVLQYAAVVALIIVSTITATYLVINPKPVEYAQLSVTNGGSQKVTLADGTIITANAGSTVIYPEDFSHSDTRTVFLTGEADFKVAKNPNKPFIVKTKHLSVTALGTYFNVKSYPNDNFTRATLIEGSVKVCLFDSTKQSFILSPNDQFVYHNNSGTSETITVDAAKLASWEKGYLIFQGVGFEEIANTLERKYNVTINYDNHKLNKNQSYFIKFSPDESVDNVMRVLSKLVENSTYKIDGKNIYFYSK